MFTLLSPEWKTVRFEDLRLGRSLQYFYFPLPPCQETFDYLRGLLTEEESARAARFIRPADQERAIASRGALRHLLGPDVELAKSPEGRPLAVGDGHPQFNVSHSGCSLLIGFHWGGRIGVDVEHHRPGDSEFLLSTMTDRERACDAAMQAEDRRQFRYVLWTRKEAALKATGAGLRQDPAQLDVLDDASPSGLCLASFPIASALASIADDPSPRTFHHVTW